MVANNINYIVSKNKHTTDEDKNNQIHSQIKIHNEHLKNINKIEKYKKLNLTKHITHMNITKIDKYKKLNMTEYKTDMNITKIDKYKKLIMLKRKTDMNITKIDKYKKLNMAEHKTDMNISEIKEACRVQIWKNHFVKIVTILVTMLFKMTLYICVYFVFTKTHYFKPF